MVGRVEVSILFIMRNFILLSSIFLLFFPVTSHSFQILKAREIESYFYHDGKMKKSDGEFEITYKLIRDKVIRTKVYNFVKHQNIPDDTVYTIQRELSSDPSQNIRPHSKSVIRAVGQPGTDAIEILVIFDNYIQTVKSTSDYFVISRFVRIH